jgi:quinol monooxygenase YgiN
MNSSLFVIAKITAHAGHAAPVRAAIERIIAPTRAEAGCQGYDLFLDRSNDHCFLLQEQWQNKDALDGHMETAHFKTLVASIVSIADLDVKELDQLS